MRAANGPGDPATTGPRSWQRQRQRSALSAVVIASAVALLGAALAQHGGSEADEELQAGADAPGASAAAGPDGPVAVDPEVVAGFEEPTAGPEQHRRRAPSSSARGTLDLGATSGVQPVVADRPGGSPPPRTGDGLATDTTRTRASFPTWRGSTSTTRSSPTPPDGPTTTRPTTATTLVDPPTSQPRPPATTTTLSAPSTTLRPTPSTTQPTTTTTRPSPPTTLPRDPARRILFDSFDRELSPSQLSRSTDPSGRFRWRTSGRNPFRTTHGVAVQSGEDGPGYLATDLGQIPRSVSMSVLVDQGFGQPEDGNLCITVGQFDASAPISRLVNTPGLRAIHVAFTSRSAFVQFVENGPDGQFRLNGAATFTMSMAADAPGQYTVAIELDGPTIRVRQQDGSVHSFTDERIARYAGTSVFWEVLRNRGAQAAAIAEVSASA